MLTQRERHVVLAALEFASLNRPKMNDFFGSKAYDGRIYVEDDLVDEVRFHELRGLKNKLKAIA